MAVRNLLQNRERKMGVENRTRNAKRNIMWAIFNKIIRLVLTFVMRTMIIKLMGSLFLGLDSLFTSVLQILNLAEMGVGSAIVFSMYEPMATGDDDRVCALMSLYKKLYRYIGVGVLVAGLAIMPFLTNIIHGDVPQGVSIYVLYAFNLANTVLSYWMFAYTGSLLQASQRRDVLSNIETVINILSGVSRIALLWLFRNYYIYTIVLPTMTLISNLITYGVTRRMYPHYRPRGDLDKETTTDITKRIAGAFIFKLSNVCRNAFDSIVLSGFLGLTTLAKYNNYYYILNCIANFLNLIPASMNAGIGHSLVTESVEKNHIDMLKFNLLYNWITAVCTCCLFCLYQPFITWWVGDDWLFSRANMAIFCLYFFCLHSNGVIHQYRQAAGIWWQDRTRFIVEAILNLVLDVALVKMTGVTGVLLASISTLVFINTMMGTTVIFREYFGKERQIPFLLRLWWFGFVTAIICLLAEFLCNLIPYNGMISILERAVVAGLTPLILFPLINSFLPEFKDAVWFVKHLARK